MTAQSLSLIQSAFVRTPQLCCIGQSHHRLIVARGWMKNGQRERERERTEKAREAKQQGESGGLAGRVLAARTANCVASINVVVVSSRVAPSSVSWRRKGQARVADAAPVLSTVQNRITYSTPLARTKCVAVTQLLFSREDPNDDCTLLALFALSACVVLDCNSSCRKYYNLAYKLPM